MPGIRIPTHRAPLGGIREVGVGMDDYARIAAQLQGNFLGSRSPLEVPADYGRACECEQLEAIVLG